MKTSKTPKHTMYEKALLVLNMVVLYLAVLFIISGVVYITSGGENPEIALVLKYTLYALVGVGGVYSITTFMLLCFHKI